eukprot:6599849-Prymnesium_polylepis.1
MHGGHSALRLGEISVAIAARAEAVTAFRVHVELVLDLAPWAPPSPVANNERWSGIVVRGDSDTESGNSVAEEKALGSRWVALRARGSAVIRATPIPFTTGFISSSCATLNTVGGGLGATYSRSYPA